MANPKQLDKVQIGDAGSDSAALTDHHAFLFDRSKNLLVIPVRAVSTAPVMKGDYYNYQPQIWYGAYVFGLTPQTALPSGAPSSMAAVTAATTITAARHRR